MKTIDKIEKLKRIATFVSGYDGFRQDGHMVKTNNKYSPRVIAMCEDADWAEFFSLINPEAVLSLINVIHTARQLRGKLSLNRSSEFREELNAFDDALLNLSEEL